jgi:uncharacterized protein (TIGR02996 family)
MSDERGLLAAIADDPDNDDLRRVYADWCEDNGQPGRAEFIRIQLELEAMPYSRPNEHDPRRHALDLKQTELLWEFRDAWLSDLPDVDGVEYLFQRGLPSWVRFDSQGVFRRLGRRVFRAGLVELLTLRRQGADQVLQSPLLAGLTHLDLPGQALRDPDIEVLAESPFHRLRWLDLGHNHAGAIGLGALARSPLLAGLRFLSLTGTYGSARAFDDAGAAILAQSRQPRSLKTLLLAGNRIGSEGAACLANSRSLAALEALDLSSNPLEDAGAEALAQSRSPQKLRWLSLRATRLGGRGLAALVASPLVQSLDTLDLSSNPLTNAVVETLGRSPRLTSLRSLNLMGCSLGDASARALAGNPALAGLRCLDLGSNFIHDEGARALGESPHLRNLEVLILAKNPIHKDVLRVLKERLGARVRL